MDEFFNLFLEGKQAQSRIKLRCFVRLFSVGGALLGLVPVFIAVPAENMPRFAAHFPS